MHAAAPTWGDASGLRVQVMCGGAVLDAARAIRLVSH